MNQIRTGCGNCIYNRLDYCSYSFQCHGTRIEKDDAGNWVTVPVTFANLQVEEPQLAAHCLICGKEVLVHKFEEGPKICDECKEAIEWAKKQLALAKHPTASDSTFDTDVTHSSAKDDSHKEFKVGDRIIIHLESGDYKGTVHNVSNYRPPEEMYAIDLDDYKDDYVFVGGNMLEELKDDSN